MGLLKVSRAKRLELTVSMMKRSLCAAALVAGLLFCPQWVMAQYDAVTQPRYDLKMGFTVPGQVSVMKVKQGDHIKKDETLAELEDSEGEALVKLYEIRANSDLEALSAKAKLDLAVVERDRLADLVQQHAASKFELERAKASAEVAKLEADMALRQRAETDEQLKQAASRHARYILKAPIDGFVDQLSVAVGENVEANKPVIRLVATETLWIDTAVPTGQTLKLKLGDAAWVKSKLAGYEKPVVGKIIFLASVADAASDTRPVRVEIANSQTLPAGGHVVVYFADPDVKAASTK
jgi:multidrug efflux system membrane fusion protein